MAKTVITAEQKPALDRLFNGLSATKGAVVLTTWEGSVRSQEPNMGFANDDVIFIPEDAKIFKVPVGTAEAQVTGCLVVDGQNKGRAMRFYPSALSRAVDEYVKQDNGEYVATGNRIQAAGSAVEKFQSFVDDAMANAMKEIVGHRIKVSNKRKVATKFGERVSEVTVFDWDFVD